MLPRWRQPAIELGHDLTAWLARKACLAVMHTVFGQERQTLHLDIVEIGADLGSFNRRQTAAVVHDLERPCCVVCELAYAAVERKRLKREEVPAESGDTQAHKADEHSTPPSVRTGSGERYVQAGDGHRPHEPGNEPRSVLNGEQVGCVVDNLHSTDASSG